MKKRFFPLVLAFSVIFVTCSNILVSANVQNSNENTVTYGTGMIDTEETIAPFVATCAPYQCANTRTILPSKCDLSTSQYFPQIKDQGVQGSCVAWATAYYQFTYAKNKLLGIATTVDNAASPAWVYNLRARSNDGGMLIADAYNHLTEIGDVTEEEFPYDETDYLSWVTDEDALINALNVRIAERTTLSVSGSTITSVNANALYSIKDALYSGNVLTASIILSPGMRSAYKYYDGKKIYYRGACGTNDDNSLIYSNHLVAIVGYDDTIWIDINGNGVAENSEYGAFKIANSWGTSGSWGNNGFIWVSYDSLNATSQVSGNWESSFTSTRRSMFTLSSNNTNLFFMITVENKKPLFIGKISTSTTNRQNIKIEATSSEISSYGTYTRDQDAPFYGKHYSTASFNSSLFLDLTPTIVYTSDPSITSIQTTFKITDYNFEGTAGYVEAPLTNCTYKIIDNLGATLYTYSYTFTLNNTSRSISKNFAMNVRGDVNYDGTVNSVDAQMVLQYGSGTRSLSYLQQYYADYNMDGTINASDAMAILQAAS